jgi:hypothetical protein
MSDPVENHRETLELLAEYGQTDLAKDARELLTASDSGG